MCIVCKWNSGEEKVDLSIDYLNCESCTSLTSIPVMGELKYLDCVFCRSLTSIPVVGELYCASCKWLDKCSDYDGNIKALRICQAIFKRKLTARKLETAIPVITEIYYSPGCKGAYLAQRAFLTKSRDMKKLPGELRRRDDYQAF